MSISRMVGVVPLLLAVFFVGGCAGDGRQAVSGTVKYKGQPVKAGTISFMPEGGTAPVGGAAIVAGGYEVPAVSGLPVGKYKVSISAFEGGAAPKAGEAPGESGPPPKEMIPAKYNASTDLKAEVKSGTKNVLDFNLD